HKILCSGIMGGIAPIAVGLAWAIKERKGKEFVYCFLGDMTATSGIVHEAMAYESRHDLPITWIVEDNGLSVMTPTQKSWGEGHGRPDIERYYYTLSRPHSGIGAWVRF